MPNTEDNPSLIQSLRLGFLAIPLSFVAIPLYLNISDFYARNFSLDLIKIGLLLIFVRAIDLVQDPIIGKFSDQLAQKNFSHQKILRYACIFLALSFFAVFNPPSSLNTMQASLWFVLTLVITYTGFNFAVINFESLIALTAKNDYQRISLNSLKEFLGLIGMILAFTLPTIFGGDEQKSYLLLSAVFVGLILLFLTVFLPRISLDQSTITQQRISLFATFKDRNFVFLLSILAINSIATSLPAANLNFFTRDVLDAESKLGWFLSIYFLSACFFIPLWKFFFNRFGIIKSWICAIIGSVLTFIFAYFLDHNNANLFYIVCLFSGMFLGADLIAAPAILGNISSRNPQITSSYFALWNMVNKFGLMIAASGSLIILGFLGYHPRNFSTANLDNIKFFYALLPCALKLCVIWLLIKFRNYEN